MTQQPFIPIGGLPGQRSIIHEGMAREYTLVVRHTKLLLFYVMCLVFPAVVANTLIIGPSLGYAAVAVGILWGIVKVQEALEGTPRWAVVALGASATMLWLFAGFDLVDSWWWSVRCNWHVRNKLLFLLWTGGGLFVLWLACFRSSYEIVEANWAPTISIRPWDWGILWPWNQPRQTQEEDWEEEEASPRSPPIEQLPRPVPNYGSRGVEATERIDSGLYDRVVAPSGRTVQVTTLLEFAGLAPKIGAVFESWKGRRVSDNGKVEWDLGLWQDVVDTWAIFGVVTERQHRTKTRVLVSDPREAAARLREILDRGEQ